MASTIKVLRKVAARYETTPGTYLAPTVLQPFTSFTVDQGFDMIQDEGIVGIAVRDLPNQGSRMIEGSLVGEIDCGTIDPILHAAFGARSAPGTITYTLPVDKNQISLSIAGLDSQKCYKYAGCYLKNLVIASNAGEKVTYSSEVVGWKAEVREAVGNFPSISTNPDVDKRLLHYNAGETNGYIRIGDHADALAAGDNMLLESFEVEINNQFDNHFANAQGTLQPLSAQAGRPEVMFRGKIARHDADTFPTWRDALTKLQADIMIYRSATDILQIQIPNFVLSEVSITEDDVAGIEFVAQVGRNGIGASYENGNMAFNSAVKAILTYT
jgi:hypothetical protein